MCDAMHDWSLLSLNLLLVGKIFFLIQQTNTDKQTKHYRILGGWLGF